MADVLEGTDKTDNIPAVHAAACRPALERARFEIYRKGRVMVVMKRATGPSPRKMTRYEIWKMVSIDLEEVPFNAPVKIARLMDTLASGDFP
jgi:hypothetical protein